MVALFSDVSSGGNACNSITDDYNLHYQFSRFKDDPVVFEILAGGFFKNKKIKNDCYNESYNAILNYLARLDDVSYNNILEKITQTNDDFDETYRERKIKHALNKIAE